MWNSLEAAKLLATLGTPIAVAFIGYWISKRLSAYQINRQKEAEARNREAQALAEERRQRQDDERQLAKDELERRHTPHIAIQIEAEFLGRRNGQILTNFTVLAENAGSVMHKFPKIIFRVRGIKDEPFQPWPGREPLAYFPHKVLETDLVNPGWNFIFIEPGITQRISLATLIPEDYTYIVAHVEFEYKEYWPHTAQAVYVVPRDA